MEEPRAYTAEEATEHFLDFMKTMVKYWAKVPGKSDEEKLEGLLFSFLVLLDGDTMTGTTCDVVMRPHPEDEAYLRENGENWYEDGTVLEGPLHEMLYRKERTVVG